MQSRFAYRLKYILYRMSSAKELAQSLCQTALENSPLFIGIYEPTQQAFIFINQKGLEMFDVNAIDSFNHWYHKGIYVGIAVADKEKEMQMAMSQGKTWTEDLLFGKPNGRFFWGRIFVKQLDESGKWLINIADIQSEKSSLEKFSEGEARFEAMFMHAAIGIVMIDKESKIVLTNRFANGLFGYAPDELLGKPIEILLPSTLSAAHRSHTAKYLEKPQIRPMGIGMDLKARKKDGTLFSVEISLSYFVQNNNQYFISFINDITYKKKIEMEMILKNQEIKKLNESLEQEVMNRTNALVETLKDLEQSKTELEIALSKEKELGELKSRFVAMASHEFRTPLTAILSSASLIAKYPKSEDQEKREKHIHRIKSAVSNLTDILEEFLSVGKLEEGKIEAKWASFNIEDLINDVLSDLRNLTKTGQKIVYINQNCEQIYSDKSLLRKILINLCSNAIKFSGDESSITIQTASHADGFSLAVSDQGIGISEEDQKHLFDRFFRGVNVTNIQGTGLGLHIVAKYTEILGGKVQINSQLNLGTTVIVEFPLLSDER